MTPSPVRALEVEGEGLNLISKGIGALWRIGERANAVASSKQSRSDVAPGIAERTCYDVQFIHPAE